jgi:uncharacterized cupredoxin-like copper-binding protein
MKGLAWICGLALLAAACGGGAASTEVSSATSSPARAVATLSAPLAAATVAATASPQAAAVASASPIPPNGASSSAAPSNAAPASPAAEAQTSASPAAAAAPSSASASAAPAATAAPQSAPPSTPAAPAFSGTLKVTLTDNAIRPDRTSVPAGPVTFSIVNTGYLPHELIVLQTSVPQDQLPLSTSDPKMVQTPGQVGAASNIAPGATATLSLNLAAGPYVLICNIENHYKDGMHVALTVGGS